MAHQKIVYGIDERTAIVLVEPENPDNIGAVARAMKNMGLRRLRLVSPPKGWRKQARKMAMSAYDLLEDARVYRSVRRAVADAQWVIGTTRRGGPRRGFFLPFKDTMEKISQENKRGKVAVLFGKESKGLDNRSLALCHSVTTIPVHPDYPSINLAQAVMIVSFKLFEGRAENADISQFKSAAAMPKRGKKKAAGNPDANKEERYLNHAEIQTVLDRFEEALDALDYGDRGHDLLKRIRTTMNRLIKRGGLLEGEAQMLRGLSRRICEKIDARSKMPDKKTDSRCRKDLLKF